MTTAYVLSGGASHGSIQVGMAIALEERGIAPDLIVGTSVGAVNGAWLAGEDIGRGHVSEPRQSPSRRRK